MDLEGEKYKDVDSQSGSDIMDFRPIVSRRFSLRSILLGCIGSFALAAFMITVTRYPWGSEDSNYYTWTDCGSTPSQARERGCHYEPMGRYWAPPECSFPELVEEYHPFQDREWFLDTNLTVPANVSRLESGDARRAYTQYWHDEHCTYMLRNLAMSVALKKTMVTGLVGSIHHFKHCSMTIVGGLKKAYNASFLENDQSITESILGFEACVPLNDLVHHESHSDDDED